MKKPVFFQRHTSSSFIIFSRSPCMYNNISILTMYIFNTEIKSIVYTVKNIRQTINKYSKKYPKRICYKYVRNAYFIHVYYVRIIIIIILTILTFYHFVKRLLSYLIKNNLNIIHRAVFGSFLTDIIIVI